MCLDAQRQTGQEPDGALRVAVPPDWRPPPPLIRALAALLISMSERRKTAGTLPIRPPQAVAQADDADDDDEGEVGARAG